MGSTRNTRCVVFSAIKYCLLHTRSIAEIVNVYIFIYVYTCAGCGFFVPAKAIFLFVVCVLCFVCVTYMQTSIYIYVYTAVPFFCQSNGAKSWRLRVFATRANRRELCAAEAELRQKKNYQQAEQIGFTQLLPNFVEMRKTRNRELSPFVTTAAARCRHRFRRSTSNTVAENPQAGKIIIKMFEVILTRPCIFRDYGV